MIRLLTLIALVFTLAACGGSEPDSATPPADAPAVDAPAVNGNSDDATDDAAQSGGNDYLNAEGQDTGAMCGGLAGLTCANASDYCAFDEGQCWMPDASGTCQPKPEMCTQQYEPVCGCDGETYGNACEAASAGVSIMSQGECAAGGRQTGEE
ncbi:hypothetical protein GCM10011342_28880 [Aquisalinus flavus]|uniref:Kazal-like domain-containing protein n=1 Tax=Aquisalinus flavus TaxID=1526572 RepID=A0A8J2V7E1_9PROT|nr:Kazal-type serine protease inhibitor [Aquisalinus flavus]MBD0428132.1 serine protease [Aquisalinus flavus]GGD18440.1 hypothetical protein GCM10011342_28880 [Aquisalinus flavus]